MYYLLRRLGFKTVSNGFRFEIDYHAAEVALARQGRHLDRLKHAYKYLDEASASSQGIMVGPPKGEGSHSMSPLTNP